jgi:hypothetical protein
MDWLLGNNKAVQSRYLTSASGRRVRFSTTPQTYSFTLTMAR